MPESLYKNIIIGTKWSAITELVAKIASSLVSLTLARLLAPEAFGVVASVMMIVSFAQIFTDAGFQKYIVQHENKGEEDLSQITNVAFWSNLVLSILLWLLIFVCRDALSSLVGCPSKGAVLSVAALAIPFSGFSSIQMALYKRKFDFKTLFRFRLVNLLVPLLVTIPLAFLWHSYWAIVIGTLSVHILNGFLFIYFSSWRPGFYFSFPLLKQMLSFSSWSLFDSLSVWLTATVDVFIVGVMLSQHALGLYKTSIILVSQIFCVVTSVANPILFSALSRLQNDKEEFFALFFKFQRYVSLLVFPIGLVVFSYNDWVTYLFLGEQWMEASFFIGFFGLVFPLVVTVSRFCSEIYRSLGKPKLSVLAQWLYIFLLCPSLYFSVKAGWEQVCAARVYVTIAFVGIHLMIMWRVIKKSPIVMIENIIPLCALMIALILVAHYLRGVDGSFIWQVITLLIVVTLYVVGLFLFPRQRMDVKGLWDYFLRQSKSERNTFV